MITGIGNQGIFAVLPGVERIQGIHIGIRTSEKAFKFVKGKIADDPIIIFIRGLGTFMHQIREGLAVV